MFANVRALHRAFVVFTGLSLVLALLAWGVSAHARVTRIVIDTKVSPAFGGALFGGAGQYETLRDAPLGTYLGWNVTAAGFHKDKICNYAGGMIPFAKTRAERLASGDPRLSLQ